MSRKFAAILASIAGLVMVASVFIRRAQSFGEIASDWFNILQAIAFVLGGANLMKINLTQLSQRRAGWGYGIVTIVAFLSMLGIGLLKIGAPPAAIYPNVAMSGDNEAVGTGFWWLYEYGMSPITSTLFGMLAFYVASAAFRAFRAKNLEAGLLLGTAFVMLLGRVYAGFWLTQWIPETGPWGDWFGWLRLENFSAMIMAVFNNAGTRAMIIGIAIGVAATSLKILLGLDRSYLGSGD